MEDTNRDDAIERLVEPGKLQDVSLRIVDRLDTELARLSLRVGEAGAAQIDRQDFCTRDIEREIQRVLPSAAAGDQNVAGGLSGRPQRRVRKHLLLEEGIERNRFAQLRKLDPARVRIFLVLALDLERDVVLDRGELRHGVAQFPLLGGLARPCSGK